MQSPKAPLPAIVIVDAAAGSWVQFHFAVAIKYYVRCYLLAPFSSMKAITLLIKGGATFAATLKDYAGESADYGDNPGGEASINDRPPSYSVAQYEHNLPWQ